MNRIVPVVLVALALTPLALAAAPMITVTANAPVFKSSDVLLGRARGSVLLADDLGAPIGHALVHVNVTRTMWSTDISKTAQIEGFTDNAGLFVWTVPAVDAFPNHYYVVAEYGGASNWTRFNVVFT